MRILNKFMPACSDEEAVGNFIIECSDVKIAFHVNEIVIIT